MLQSKPQHLMYYMEGAYSDNGGTYHILGEPANLINYTVDGANVKQSIRSAIGETSTSLTVPVDSVAEAQVWTTGIPAEVGHSAGGTYNMVLKSGTNQLHFASEERYINKDFVDRAYFQQSVANLATAPFEYHNFDAALSSIGYLQMAEQDIHVPLYGAFSDSQPGCDLSIAQAVDNKFEDLQFTVGQFRAGWPSGQPCRH